MKTTIGQWAYNIFQACSCLLCAITFGCPRTSTSQRTAIAFNKYKGTGTLAEKWFTFQQGFIDILLWAMVQEKNHCQNSIVGETNTLELWHW